MGSRRPGCTLSYASSSANTADHNLHPGAKMPREPSPRPPAPGRPERERDGARERRESGEPDWTRDKARRRETEPRGERGHDRPRRDERERRERERERRPEDERRRNGRPGEERKMKKGDTFPRIRKDGRAATASGEERGERRERERPQRADTDKWEGERDRTWQRGGHRERERGEEEGEERSRFHEPDGRDRRRDGPESWDARERDRRRERPRNETGERERRDVERAPRRDGKRDTRSEGDSDERETRREERARERASDELTYQQSRSEGDNEGRTVRERERERERGWREREGERSGRKGGERERERYREADRREEREGERRRETREERVGTVDRREREQRREREERREELRREERGEDRRREEEKVRSSRSPRAPPPRAQSSGEWSSDGDGRRRRDRDSYEERERRREGERVRGERRDSEEAAERGQGSRHRSERDRREVTEGDREQRRMWLEPQRDPRRRREEEGEGRGREGEKERYAEQWGDGGRETEEVSVDGEVEEVEEGRRERFKTAREQLSDSDGGMEGSRRRDGRRTDNAEESDGGEEDGGRGDDHSCSGSEGGSEEARWRADRERMISGEDIFITVSSGGDEERGSEEDEFKDCQEFPEGGKEEEEEEEEEEGKTQKKKKIVFCVIGQTLPRSDAGGKSQTGGGGGGGGVSEAEVRHRTTSDLQDGEGGSDRCPPSSVRRHHSSDDLMLHRRNHNVPVATGQDGEEPGGGGGGEGGASEVEVRYRTASELEDGGEGARAEPYEAAGTIKRDSQTERLLREWRERNMEGEGGGGGGGATSPLPANPYENVPAPDSEDLRPFLEQINSGAMSPEEVEAIRIRMSGAWSMSEEPKRHSQAPHLKWAKTVVREILGKSDEQALDGAAAEEPGDQRISPDQVTPGRHAHAGEEDLPVFKLTEEEEEQEEDEDGELLGASRGTERPVRTAMHAEPLAVMHVDNKTATNTHANTLLDSQRTQQKTAAPVTIQLDRPGGEERREGEREREGEERRDDEAERNRQKEVKIFLSVSNTLYKPSSCPVLNYNSDSELPGDAHSSEGDLGGSGEELEEEEEEEGVEVARQEEEEVGGERVEVDRGAVEKTKASSLSSSCSFRDLGPEARIRRRGIRKTAERRKREEQEEEEEEEQQQEEQEEKKQEEGVARDRRTRIFSITEEEEDGRSRSWGEVELRNVLETINRQKRNSRFFNAAQLYQQYSEDAQNFEILRQARSEVRSEDSSSASSPAPSPPPARRPLPPLPAVAPHPHSLSHGGSVTSVRSLPLPEPPRGGRPASPRLSISLSQSPSLWRDLPAVRSSTELEELSEDQRRLQEVRFEVVTSEASYCRSLDIVVEHFVKSKSLNALLTTQDRNWLFSRLADVRAISHSFLSKLEERVESDMIHFTVCDIIARHCQRFKMVYVPYLTNQSYQDATYQRLMNENVGFRRIVEKLERSHVCQRLPLRSFLVLPFQRITRIKLLVQNIVKRTSPGTPEATHAIKSLKLIEKLIQESNDSITQMKSIESLVSLSSRVDFECRTLPLISQSRRLVREGLVTELMDFSLKDTERNVYMHLFNDYLLLSLHREGGRFTVIDHSPVSELRAENCRVKLHSLQKNLFRLHMSRSKALLLRTDTQSDKLRWISALSRPHPEVDFSAAQDFDQMQCIRAVVAQQPDELSLEKADVVLVHQQSSDNWVEGTRLSDRQRGWIPSSHLEIISNSRVRQRNLADALKLTTATAAL